MAPQLRSVAVPSLPDHYGRSCLVPRFGKLALSSDLGTPAGHEIGKALQTGSNLQRISPASVEMQALDTSRLSIWTRSF